jgi:hypothetical protein
VAFFNMPTASVGMAPNLRSEYEREAAMEQSLRDAALAAALSCLLFGVCAVHAAPPSAERTESNVVADFKIELPQKPQPFPTPLPPGKKPGFAIRGTKRWNWTAEQYLEEIPVLAKYKMNFLMNCYLSMFSHSPERRNEWWRPIPDAKKAAYAKVIRSCREHGITFCFALHPQADAPRPLNPASSADFEDLWQHYAWAQGQGVKWFSVCIDDVDAHVADFPFVEKLFERLRAKDPTCQFIFRPSIYSDTGANQPYLTALAKALHPDIYIFWTGLEGYRKSITRQQAQAYRDVVKHRLILWDNYPVNDAQPTMHLGPLSGRDPELCKVVDGFMANPMCPQNQINRAPLLTVADFAYNPWAYDPMRSIGQTIVHLADSQEQRLALKAMIETYPGMLVTGVEERINPVRAGFERLLQDRRRRAQAASYIAKHARLAAQFQKAFPDRFADARTMLENDVRWMEGRMSAVIEKLTIELPDNRREFPTPLPPGEKPGFAIRGTKGMGWTPEQDLEVVPVLAKYKMNFYMPCYLSMYSHFPEMRNDWWRPIPAAKKAAYVKVMRSCKEHGIDYCFALNPKLHTSRPLKYDSKEDFEQLWQHYAWAQSQGVKWFSICIDDVDAHVEDFPFVEKLFERLRVKDPACQLIFCPSYYWGNATHPAERAYLEIAAKKLHPDIYLFWTGRQGVSRDILRKDAEGIKGASKHRMIVWDNYPWNASEGTVHLGPLTRRDLDLCEVADGYMANPISTDHQISLLPLLTLADFAYNPRAYDPVRSIGQAIAHLADTQEQRLVLKDLVETYPGWVIFGGDASTNVARSRFERLLKDFHRRAEAAAYAGKLAELAERMEKAFPDRFGPAKQIVKDDAKWINARVSGQ